MIRVIPNIISFGRLAAVPLAVWLILDDRILTAFWLFVAAGVSDAVDGFIAKRFHAVTLLGSFLDPLADKVLLVSVYITLGVVGYLDNWLVILVVFRDLLIVGGALVFQTMTQSLVMQPLFISKINTVAQILLAALVLGAVGYNLDAGMVLSTMLGVVAITTLLSGVMYVVKWTRKANAMEDRQ